MPVQAPQWTEFLLCPICTQTFEETVRRPISLGCGHTVCKMCLNKLHRKACPFDQTAIATDIEQLPVNTALLQLVGGQVPKIQPVALITSPEDAQHYEEASQCVEELALYLKPLSNTRGVGLSSTTLSMLSRPMQRKLVTLVHCQLVEEEGRVRAMRAARSLGERTVTELILQHQNPQQLSSNLWAAVRARGCQFLGPAMQEEALKLVLLALEDGSALSRKVLVLFVVQRLEPRFPQASKTSIGHVVQLLYRASCFKVTKRDEDSSLMQLKEEFRTYEALRREHDSQIVQIAMEGGLRIAPDQWSSLLYGDQSHKSHMQSIIDKLQTPASFAQSVQELTIALQRTGDPANLNRLRPHLELLANIDPSPDAPPPTWEQLEKGLVAVKTVVHGLVDFIQNHSKKGADPQQPPQHSKYKTYMCRDMKQKGGCPRGASCTFKMSFPPRPTGYPYQQPPQYAPQRYIRNPPPPSEPAGLPYQDPYPDYGPPDRPYPAPHSGPPFSYPPPPHYDTRGRHGPYPGPPPPPQPYPSQRDDMVRMSPAPLEGPPYHQEQAARERYPPEGFYPPGAQPQPLRSYVREPYGRSSQPSLDYLHHRRKELMAQLEERKVIAPSPTLPHTFPSDYPPEYGEESSKAFGKCREPDYAGQYSPWSCDTIGSYIGSKDSKPKDVMAPGAMEMMNVDGKGRRGEPSMDAQVRRGTEVKDDDPIIPFGPQPTVSRFGAISRTSKTGYQTTGPMQALGSTQGPNPKHMAIAGKVTHTWHLQLYFDHSLSSPLSRVEKLTLLTLDSLLLFHQLSQPGQNQGQQGGKWPGPAGGSGSAAPVSSEQLSMELHQVEREIGKRTREMDMVRERGMD
uniref:RING-type E3 ubiquitin transferase n=1 Tax=Oncorhynchus kisutch TaxID=8019 RepID=A0A8C7JAM2_ONCKI